MFEFPMPPSANRIWRIARNRLHKSTDYQAWLTECTKMLKRQGLPIQPVNCPVSVEIAFGRHDKRRRDLDNRIKPTLDLMQAAGVLKDDSCVHRVNAWWCDETAGVRIYINPMAEV